MDTGTFLRIFLCVIGIILMLVTISALAQKKITESSSLMWGAVALIFFVTGVLIRPVMLKAYLSNAAMVLIALAVICVLAGAFVIAMRVSELIKKNNELAIRFSLLQSEYEELRTKLDAMEATKED